MTETESDVALMLRVKDGDHEAFRQLIERYQRSVINVIYRAIGDSSEAEDLAQRVFIQIYRSARRYQPTAKFTTWMFTITHNTILNERRRRARHAAESLETMAGSVQLPAHGNDPAREVSERELQERVAAAIEGLPEAQRTAVILCRFEGLAYEEIAAVIGCSESAVKSLLHRARQTLKEKLRGMY